MLTALLMVKNEADCIHLTLNSLSGVGIKRVAIYDTGSTDDTLEIVRNHPIFKNGDIELLVETGEWVNFSVCRNASISWVNTFLNPETDWILLLDANEVLRTPMPVPILIKSLKDHPLIQGIFVNQLWECKKDNSDMSFKNIKLIRAGDKWKYTGAVHELLKYDNEDKPPKIEFLKNIVLYQDRTNEREKTLARKEWDKATLEEEIKNNPNNHRAVYYLAQTLVGLGELQNALLVYEKHIGMNNLCPEEKYSSYMNSGRISDLLQKPHTALYWFSQASIHSELHLGGLRPEELILSGLVYQKLNCHNMASMYFNWATMTKINDDKIISVKDNLLASYTVWKGLGVSALKCKRYEMGRDAIEYAINTESRVEEDTKILQEYPQIKYTIPRSRGDLRLVVDESKLSDSGMGLFTKVKIPPYNVICEYGGEIRHTPKVVNTQYLLRLARDLYIDASRPTGDLGRYVNDPKDPDKLNSTYIKIPDENRCIIVSTREIEEGEEIYCSYDNNYRED
jgi:glycosyltransferase involved in cell wall biosynthesis